MLTPRCPIRQESLEGLCTIHTHIIYIYMHTHSNAYIYIYIHIDIQKRLSDLWEEVMLVRWTGTAMPLLRLKRCLDEAVHSNGRHGTDP